MLEAMLLECSVLSVFDAVFYLGCQHMAHGNSIVEILASKGVAAAPCVLIVGPQGRRYVPANRL